MELFNLVLPEPHLVEVDTYSDIEIIFGNVVDWGSSAMLVLETYVDYSLASWCRQTKTAGYSIFSHIIASHSYIVVSAVGSNTAVSFYHLLLSFS